MKIGEEIKSVLLSELLSEIGYEILAAHVSMHFEKFGGSDSGIPVNYSHLSIRKKGGGEPEFILLYPEFLNIDRKLWEEKSIPLVSFDDLYVSLTWREMCPVIRWHKALNKDIEVEVFGERTPEVELSDELFPFSYDIVRKCLEK